MSDNTSVQDGKNDYKYLVEILTQSFSYSKRFRLLVSLMKKSCGGGNVVCDIGLDKG